jgi:LmbE family N-acetylglucosaminyl deacetylase
MLSLPIGGAALPARTILCLGAHSDDIEIGCGGTILTWLQDNPDLEVRWVVLTAPGRRRLEARRSAKLFLEGARQRTITIQRFRESYLPFDGAAVKEFFEDLKKSITPDVIFTHYRHDRHQDHRLVSDLTWNTFRNHLILEYEIPKYDGDLGSPNCFVPLSRTVAARKRRFLATAFPTQAGKHWFSDETFQGLMRLRGMEAAADGPAEAFYVRKLLLTSQPAVDSRRSSSGVNLGRIAGGGDTR